MTKSLNFAMTGVAGYVAPRHLQAIKDTGNKLVAALDPNDSVGILDRYFDDVDFFTEFERFDRHADKLRREDHGKEIHYVTICSPNYLHDAHIRFAFRIGANAICEKPLVLNPWNLDALEELEQETGKRVYTVLQLRYHPAILELKKKIESENKVHDIELTYITPRGKWYFASWKGAVEKSGGVDTNIGIHFFDMLIWVFGKVKHSSVHYSDPKKMAGYLELEHARVKWFLSIDKEDLKHLGKEESKTYRSLLLDGQEFEFSEGFNDLHTTVYKEILAGRGYGIKDARPSIQLVHDLRNASVMRDANHEHAIVSKLSLYKQGRNP